jgi:hypothetical protein
MFHTAGRNWGASALGDRSGSRAAVADYLALTEDATAPSAGETTLTGEIATASGGLIRKVATYGHTTDAATYTLTATFTANGSDVLPSTPAKVGVFNAASAGIMPWSALMSPSSALLAAVGDSVLITETVTLSGS